MFSNTTVAQKPSSRKAKTLRSTHESRPLRANERRAKAIADAVNNDGMPTASELVRIAKLSGIATALAVPTRRHFEIIAYKHRDLSGGYLPDAFYQSATKKLAKTNAGKWLKLESICKAKNAPMFFYSIHLGFLGLGHLENSENYFDPVVVNTIKSTLFEFIPHDPIIAKLEIGENEKLHLHVVTVKQSNAIFQGETIQCHEQVVFKFHDGITAYLAKNSIVSHDRLIGQYILAQKLSKQLGRHRLPMTTWTHLDPSGKPWKSR